MRARGLLLALTLLVSVHKICAQAKKTIDPATLDPSTFESARKGFAALIESKPYRDAVPLTRDWECIYHYGFLVAPSCDFFGGSISNPGTCCDALKAFLDAGEGSCFCEDRVTRDPTILGLILRTIEQTECVINFPIPKVDVSELAAAFPNTPPCVGTPRTTGTLENLDFLGISSFPESNSELPTFRDLFTPPLRGPYETSMTVINVTRPEASIIVNEFSSPDEFEAVVAYPADTAKEVVDTATGMAAKPVVGKTKGPKKLPIVVFAPGLMVTPAGFALMMSHLASFGMIVIAPRSTSRIAVGFDPSLSTAWANDIAYTLVQLKREGRDKKSFLFRRVDARRAGIAGHSFGATLSFPAVAVAKRLGVRVKAVAPIQPVCIPFADLCDLAGNAKLNKIKGVKYSIIAGSQDTTALVSHAEYFRSLLKSSATLTVLDVNHCVSELDPAQWPFGLDCGRGDTAPQDQAQLVQDIVGKFLKKSLFAI